MSPIRGMGSIFRRGSVWWVKYYSNGRPIRESSRSTNRNAAVALLKKRVGHVAEGKPVSPAAERIRLAELLDDWLTTLKIEGRTSLPQARIRRQNLLDFFGLRRAQAITTTEVRNYVVSRQKQGVKPGTINLELAALKRAYSLGLAAERIFRAPRITMLPVNNVRRGFFERPQFEAVRDALRQDVLRDMATLAYWIGWRSGELRRLECRQVDVEHRALRIERGTTKGKEPRIVRLPSEAWAVVAKWYARRRVGARISRFLFHRRGKPIRTFQRAWTNACVRAGHPGMLFHDFRRTAVRNMVRAGIKESVAMAITGHRTREVFERYNIIVEDDLVDAARKLDGLLTGTSAGTIAEGEGSGNEK